MSSLLTLTKCTVIVPPATTILQDVSFSCGAGTITSLVGRSGSGKSTILRCIAGLQPYQGSITVNGVAQESVPTNQRNIGWVDQDSTLLPHLTVAQNIALPLQFRKQSKAMISQKVQHTMEQFGISHIATRKPSQISGGEQQRTAIARAIIYTPKILLLDEPFGALDAITKSELIEWIQPILNQHTITTLLVTHDLAEADYLSSQRITLKGGTVIRATPSVT